MTTLYDCTAKVKPARRFGIGVLPYVAQHTFTPYTAADAAWLLAEEIRREDQAHREAQEFAYLNRHADELAGIARAYSLHESGLAAF